MGQYRFTLEPIRRLRQAHRDAQRDRLGEALHAATILESQAAAALTELEQLREVRRVAMQRQSLDVNQLLDVQRYEFLLQGHLQTVRKQQQTIAQEVDRRRQSLAEAEQQVRVLDKLDERRREEWRRKELRHEELVLSEIALQKHAQTQNDEDLG